MTGGTAAKGETPTEARETAARKNRTGGYLVVGNGCAGEVAMLLCIIDEELLRGGALY